ncbi:MAG: hypothetical protein M9890_13140 [Thermomicrobiales bacterium]|nr:hypothetical protein [Thermomicrobiales bacterium]
MSTGDLLFIFAFIVLPTIILVSCIWTLLLIRAGVLLRDRPRVQPAGDATGDVVSDDIVDDTAIETAIVAAPTAAVVAVEPEPEAALVVEAEAPIVEPPTPMPEPEVVSAAAENAEAGPLSDVEIEERFEQTTDFPIITDAMLAEANAAEAVATPEELVSAPQPEPPAERAMPMPAPVAESPAAPPSAKAAKPAPAPDLDVLFVPLPDEEPDNAFDAVAADEPDVEDATVDDEHDGDGRESRGGRSPRKPVRRVAQLRPSEEQANSVSPMGNLLRRSRSGSPR